MISYVWYFANLKSIFSKGKKKKPSDFYLGKYKKNNKTSILVMKKTEDMKGLGFF